ncbi:MAG: ABC transporter ATP-binding protein [Bacteroidota bacterium]|nr:ABC transporter ATP-binding protein/permease [Candidatus Kapabacteria bacterium]MDW8220423.1 ABC transporter ATP-binding protein [Bacteroidota bacterium]
MSTNGITSTSSDSSTHNHGTYPPNQPSSHKHHSNTTSQHNDLSEEPLAKGIDFALLNRLLEFLRPHKVLVAGVIVLTIIVAALGPIRPKLSQYSVDTYIATHDQRGLYGMIAVIMVILIVQGILQYFLTNLMQYIGQMTIFDVRMQLFRRLQEISMRYYDTTPIGRLVTRVTNDVEVLNEVFSSGLVMIVANIFMLLWIIVMMFYTNWQLALATIGVVPILVYGTNLFRKAVRREYRQIRTHVARMNAFLNEYIAGMNVIQLFLQEERQRNEFDSINAAHTAAHIRSVFYYAVFFPFVEMMSTVSLAIVVWYAAGHIIEGTMTVGEVIAFSMFGEMFFRPIRELSDKYNTLQSAMASSERIFQLLDTTSFVRDSPNATPLHVFSHSIEFHNVTFSYDGMHNVLHNVSFTVRKGETVAIVGATGAGKSSIINLLARFYEFHHGDILIDGRSIRDIQQRSLRSHMAIVLQDVFLFSRTVADNIALGNPNISRQQIYAAAEAVGAAEFIEKLPYGYDTPVMERGATLSVGQKQLISFARALAANPAILILDEATSSVDTATEQQIEHAISTLLQGRTSIIIAHRLSTIQRADSILVLHHGRIYEYGSHQELLTRNGLYAKLYRLQYKEQLA